MEAAVWGQVAPVGSEGQVSAVRLWLSDLTFLFSALQSCSSESRCRAQSEQLSYFKSVDNFLALRHSTLSLECSF